MLYQNSSYFIFSVIPTKVGIQIYPHHLDSGLRQNDAMADGVKNQKTAKNREQSRSLG